MKYDVAMRATLLAASCYLPSFLQTPIRKTYLLQGKVLIGELLQVVCIHGIFGNPWLGTSRAAIIGSVGMGVLFGLSYPHHTEHYNDIKDLSSTSFMIAVLAQVEFGFIAIIFSKDSSEGELSFRAHAFNFFIYCAAVCATIFFHCFLIKKTKESEENDTEINSSDVAAMKKEVKDLQDRIHHFDQFILNNEELWKEAQEVLKSYEPIYTHRNIPSLSLLHPDDRDGQEMLLSMNKKALEKQIIERMVFIESNTILRECFVKQLKQEALTFSSSNN